MRRLLKIVAIGTAAVILLTAVGLAVAVYGFAYPVERLAPDAGGPLVLTDRHGTVLRSLPAAGGRPGREAWVTLDQIPPAALLTVLASEDARFFTHRGVDPGGLARAAWLNLKERRIGYGGSTITMQLVRMVHFGERRTLWTKIAGAVLALRLERALGKREILEQYLNRAYYGNGAHGLEAAARTYFDKPAAALSVGEATLLAVIPRGPRRYDPIRHLDAALARREHVFGLLLKQDLVGADEVERARAQALAPALHPPPFAAPHFVDWVIAGLPEEVRRKGGVVRTTLDLPLQQQLEHRLADHVDSLRSRGLDQAGLVTLDTQSGEILAMVGSAGFFAGDGQINIVTWRRNPGSALKPFVYALALEAGDSPASIALDVADVPSEYRVPRPSQPEHGPVRYREALAGSYNLAAVHVLEKVGVERLLSKLREAGVEDGGGAAQDYGLRLALGSARVRLLDLAAAYGFLVRGGRVRRPLAVERVAFPDGGGWRPDPAPERQIFSPEVSWLVMDMLADGEARHPVFGQELPFDLPYAVAAKTGTSRGFADTVAVAVTRELTVAAWAGNFDGEPTQGLIAMKAAAPLVRAGLQLAARERDLTLPEAPAGIVAADVCPLSGLAPGPDCPHRKRERFMAGQAPTRACDWHRVAGGRLLIRWPAEAARWAARQLAMRGRTE